MSHAPPFHCPYCSDEDRYSELRGAKTSALRATGKKKIEMSYIGG